MNELEDIRSALSTIARSTADQLHREEHFTIMLFASLWPAYSDRLLSTTGLGVDVLKARISDTEADKIRGLHLPDTKDFYADFLMTAPMKAGRLKSTMSIDAVLEQATITHICEFKYLTAFPSLSKKIAREDTYKLKILGEFIRISSGISPHMEQFVVASKRNCKHPHDVNALMNWFGDAEFRADTQGVRISIIDVDGVIHSVD